MSTPMATDVHSLTHRGDVADVADVDMQDCTAEERQLLFAFRRVGPDARETTLLMVDRSNHGLSVWTSPSR